jgi:putative flippase GtrA
MIKKIIKSGLSGAISTSVYILSAYILDIYINDKTSNFIGLLFGMIINYGLQHKTFSKTHNHLSYIHKYIIAEILIIFSSQVGVNMVLDNKKKYIKYFPDKLKPYYNTIMRILVSTLIFALISFPIRNSWVFVI